MIKSKYRNPKDIEPLEANPRKISDKDFKILCESIQKNPKYFEARPIILSDRTGKLVSIAGNQRLKASKKLGIKKVPTILLPDLTEEEEKEIIIRDNINNGDWDLDILKNDEKWNEDELTDWGFDLNFKEEEDEDLYTRKVAAPAYEPTGAKPEISELYNIEKAKELIQDIESSSIPKDVKKFLIVCAQRHIVFSYENIAEYYAHADEETQNLMENSALVIIDFDKAIELGYVKLTKDVMEQYSKQYPDE